MTIYIEMVKKHRCALFYKSDNFLLHLAVFMNIINDDEPDLEPYIEERKDSLCRKREHRNDEEA